MVLFWMLADVHIFRVVAYPDEKLFPPAQNKRSQVRENAQEKLFLRQEILDEQSWIEKNVSEFSNSYMSLICFTMRCIRKSNP